MKSTVRNLCKFVQVLYRPQGTVPLLDMFRDVPSVAVSEKAFSSVFISLSPNHKSNRHHFGVAISKLRKKEVIDSLLASDISQFLDENKIIKLKPFLKKRNNPCINYCFVIDYAVAQDIVDKISTKVNLKECIIIEGNPGLGFISLYLFKSGVSEIHFYDPSSLMPLSLDQILKVYCKDKLNLTSSNLFAKFSQQGFSTIFKSCNSKNLKVPNIIIGVVPNYSFFSHVVACIIAYNLWSSFELTEFYFVISLDVYNKILKFRNHKGKYFTYCMHNFIFETEVMAEYPREAFLPFSNVHNDKMYLIKMKKRADIFAEISKKDFPVYEYFLKIIGRSSYSFIIPVLEQWLPNCGLYLISKGISLTNQTRDLTFSDSVKLFKHLKEFDGYINFSNLVTSFKDVKVTVLK